MRYADPKDPDRGLVAPSGLKPIGGGRRGLRPESEQSQRIY